MEYRELSGKQREICQYLVSFVRERGYPPSVREIGAAVGLKSTSSVHFHLKRLAAAGLLELSGGKGRAISLTESGFLETGREPAWAGEPEPLPATESRRDRVPIVGDVAAGNPIPAQEAIEDYLTFDTGGQEGAYFALRVRGESMVNAGILPGDLVVVRRQPEAENGEIVVAMIDDEATVKRFSRRRGRVWLLPENDGYQPIDGTHARILGRVAAVVRRY